MCTPHLAQEVTEVTEIIRENELLQFVHPTNKNAGIFKLANLVVGSPY
jgi:hypothetical protein